MFGEGGRLMENFLSTHKEEEDHSEVDPIQFTIVAYLAAFLVGLGVWWLCSL